MLIAVLLPAGCKSAGRADGLVTDGYLCVARNGTEYDVTLFRNGKRVAINVDGVGEVTVLQPGWGGQIIWRDYPLTRVGIVLEAIATSKNGERVGSSMWTATVGAHGEVLPWLITDEDFERPPPQLPQKVTPR
jgi:hypothetical protein